MTDLSKATQDLFKRFSMHYMNSWVKANREDMLIQARHWKSELEKAMMSPDDVANTVDVVLKMHEFSTFPPNALQFVAIHKKQEASANNPLRAECEKAMSIIRAAYLKTKTSELEDTTNHWVTMLSEDGIPPKYIVPSVKALIKSHRYSSFPPTIVDVCYEAYRQMVNPDLPAPELIVEQGMTGALSKDPLMIEVRRRVGESRLRMADTKKADALFLEGYFSVLKDVALGNLTLDKITLEEKPQEPTESASGAISEILKNW